MRVAVVPDMDDPPPPPYTSQDTSVARSSQDSPNAATQPIQTSLRGGYIRPSLSSEEPSISSAAVYFAERPPFLHNPGPHLNLVEHDITFTSETTRDDILYPLPIETYIARDVTIPDWSTFVNYLFPTTIETSASKPKWERDVKSPHFAEEDTPERREQIQAVVAEWNENFFSPRLIHINVRFAPALSPLTSRSVPYPTAPIQKGYNPQPMRRSHSFSSTSTSSSSSSGSVDSIKSKDLEGAEISQLRSALLAFRLDPNKSTNLRLSVRQLRDEFRSQRCNTSSKDRKDLKKGSKDQRKEIKREVKAVVKEIKDTQKTDRKLRKAEKKSRREGKRAESRGLDRIRSAQEKSQKAQERAAQKATIVQERAAEKAARVRERAAEGHERAREIQARETAAAISTQDRAGDARARGWDSSAAAAERAREVEGRARETARRAQGRDWARDGRERAREAEQRAGGTAGGWGRTYDGGQESGVLED